MTHLPRLTGPGAGVEKYDLLTALSVAGLSGGATGQTSMLRLIALVTARYNWASDELSMGHKEMASLWSVDERTAKRETKRLMDAGFLSLKRKGARGRVSCYRLCIEGIFAMSEPVWPQIGPDFRERMIGREGSQGRKVVKVDFAARRPTEDAAWEATAQALRAANPARFAAWYDRLRPQGFVDGVLTLDAGSAFVLQYVQTHLMAELTEAAAQAYPGLRRCLLVENRL